jgi:hypothetical protein
MTVLFAGYESKADLLTRFAAQKRVLHLGAVGCTLGSTQAKVEAAASSVHAFLTRISTCVGIDIDRDAVEGLTGVGCVRCITERWLVDLPESIPQAGHWVMGSGWPPQERGFGWSLCG